MAQERPGIVPDDVPRRGLFREPIRVDALDALPVEPLDDGRVRVTFRVSVRDADGKRGPDLAVEARVTGPDRTAEGMGHTDLMGQVRFRMVGPPGRYVVEVLDVAAGGLAFDRGASVLTAEIEA